MTGEDRDGVTSTDTSPVNPPSSPAGSRKIEVGIICGSELSAGDRDCIQSARSRLQQELAARFPGFDWRFPIQTIPENGVLQPAEPSELLRTAADIRDAAHWDFALLVTRADLVGHYRPFALSALSRPLDAAVLSLARLQSDARSSDRLATLLTHAIAHLSGLEPHPDPHNILHHPQRPELIDRMQELTADQHETWLAHLEEIADQRLEELSERPRRLGFLLRAGWINRHEILEAVQAARPWQFPYRLSRLTTAAVSTVAVLLMTAEAWDLGLSLATGQLTGLMATAMLATTSFVVLRQQLLLNRATRQTEQSVVTGVSAVTIVLFGMLTTWIAMMLIALIGGSLLFGSELITGWAPATLANPEQVGPGVYLRMSTFVASVAILIGALGASFEAQHYFRHVIFVDEEI